MTKRITRVGLFLAILNGVMMPGGAAVAQVRGVDPGFAALIEECAPTVHPETMASVISAESRGHQYAIADAGPVNLPWAQRKALVRSLYPSSLIEAEALARSLIDSGHTVSLGLAQVNDRNLSKLGLTIRAMFDPCTNIAAGGKILTDFYTQAAQKYGDSPRALRAAISAYNSGDFMRGEKEGYVSLVYRQVGIPLEIKTGGTKSKGGTKRPPTLPSPETEPPGFAMSSSGFDASE